MDRGMSVLKTRCWTEAALTFPGVVRLPGTCVCARTRDHAADHPIRRRFILGAVKRRKDGAGGV